MLYELSSIAHPPQILSLKPYLYMQFTIVPVPVDVMYKHDNFDSSEYQFVWLKTTE